jgi:hypothetical protein
VFSARERRALLDVSLDIFRMPKGRALGKVKIA